MTVALCMIVKNEAPVIERCLASVRDHIDAFFICDTGSSDATPVLAARSLEGKRGEIVQSSWVDFAHNRNEALRGAEDLADWVLFIDADEVFEGRLPLEASGKVGKWESGPESGPEGEAKKNGGASSPPSPSSPSSLAQGPLSQGPRPDGFRARIVLGDTTFYRPLLVRSGLPWQFRGAVHEYLMCAGPARLAATEAFQIRSFGDGARQRAGDKFLRDIQVLRAAIDRRREPRDVFYLAQSYLLAGFPTEAIKYYEERIAIRGGNQKERWYAKYQIARAYHQLKDHDRAVSAYLAAHDAGSDASYSRAEPLYHLGMLYFERNEFHVARLFLQRAAACQRAELPNTELFVEEPIYQWRALDNYAVACFNCRDYEAARAIVEVVLDVVPEQEVDRVNENLLAIEEAMGEGWEGESGKVGKWESGPEGEEKEPEGIAIRGAPRNQSDEPDQEANTEPAPNKEQEP